MLTIVEGRVLGCLLEKERTTPDQYPLTLNALVTACNQSTNRDPVMAVDPHDAEAAIGSMKVEGLARMVHPTAGRSATRYRQVANEHFQWSDAEAALMAVLLLRGPQTLAELRTRTERSYDFGSLDEIEAALDGLAARPEPQVVHLERQSGQKETRWQQLIGEEAEHAPRHSVGAAVSGGVADRVTQLEADVARIPELEERIARLEAAIADLL